MIASFAVLSIGSRAIDDRLDTEARRLEELMALAADEATLQGVDLGFIRTTEGYAFLVMKDGKWTEADEGPLRARAVPEPFLLQLRVEGRPVAPYDPENAREPPKPQVLLLSSGEATEFALDLRVREHAPHYLIQGDALGRMKVERKEGAS